MYDFSPWRAERLCSSRRTRKRDGPTRLCYLPRIDGDHSNYTTTFRMLDGKVKGFFAVGENPAVGSAHGKLQRLAMAKLDWLVVRDLYETETASFWKDSPEVAGDPVKTREIKTEVFFLPAAAVAETPWGTAGAGWFAVCVGVIGKSRS